MGYPKLDLEEWLYKIAHAASQMAEFSHCWASNLSQRLTSIECDRSIAQLAEHFQVHAKQIATWK